MVIGTIDSPFKKFEYYIHQNILDTDEMEHVQKLRARNEWREI